MKSIKCYNDYCDNNAEIVIAYNFNISGRDSEIMRQCYTCYLASEIVCLCLRNSDRDLELDRIKIKKILDSFFNLNNFYICKKKKDEID